MLRERFKNLASMLLVAAGLLTGQLEAAPRGQVHDDHHRDRCRVPTAGETHRRRMKLKRRRRNQIAFESRRRNWAT